MSEGPAIKPRAKLTVGGKNVGLNKFVEGALVGVVEGFLSSLKKIGDGDLVITIPADRRQGAGDE